MLEDDDVGGEIGRGNGSHDVMGISSYRDKTTSSLLNSMSHSQGAGDGAGSGFFTFPPTPNGFIDRMSDEQDKMRFHGYESSSVVAAAYPAAVYDSAGMLSEMFDFGGGGRQSVTTAAPAELLGLVDQQNPHISGIHAGDSAAAAMHLFFTNPPLKSSPPYTSTVLIPDQGFHAPQFTWIPEGTPAAEGQGLSLSLASSLEAAKVEELRMRTTVGGGYGGTTNTSHEMMFFNAAQESRAAAASSSSNSYQQLHFGFGTTSSSVFSLAAVNVLRNSKYTRPAQELLEEFCSVGRGNHHKKTGGSTNSGGGGSSTKDPPPLSPADRMEHQRRKVKLATMLDEVARRYSHYCEQMQMVVNSFEMVMGFGAAVPYTALAQKAMSRHFRCLKDGIQAQLRQCCEVLGEKDLAGGMGITKGETPRLKMLEQNLRKQRAFHQMGFMEQEAWRPQRGLPERSVNILRAWLFEHFLHPYPSDADKHLLARQTGLSRNQVANWFINARVRLWKPMIEDMYQQESKEHDDQEDDDDDEESISRSAQTPMQIPLNSSSSTSAPTTTTTTTTTTLAINDNDPSLISSESAQFIHQIPNYMLRHHHQPTTATGTADTSLGPTSNAHFTTTTTSYSHVEAFGTSDRGAAHHDSTTDVGVGPTMIRFGGTTPSATGDVSLTLGLRQGAAVAGRNPPDKTGFSFTDFGRSS